MQAVVPRYAVKGVHDLLCNKQMLAEYTAVLCPAQLGTQVRHFISSNIQRLQFLALVSSLYERVMHEYMKKQKKA